MTNKRLFLFMIVFLFLISIVSSVNAENRADISKMNYTNTFFTTTAKESNPIDVFLNPNGSIAYITGYNSDLVHQYKLTTPYNISSAIWTNSFTIGRGETVPSSIFFKYDGSRLYVMGQTKNSIIEYSLSTAWNVSTASYVRNKSILFLAGVVPMDMFIGNNGTYAYVVDAGYKLVKTFKMTTAWDVSTLTALNQNLTTSLTTISGIWFRRNGKVMYLHNSNTDDSVRQYNLSSAWNLSTAIYSGNLKSLLAQDTLMYGMYGIQNDTKIYVVGDTNDKIFQYKSLYDGLNSIVSNYTITAKSSYDLSSINSFTVKIQNGTTTKNYYTSIGTINKILSTDKRKYNITFYNWTGFNRTYNNYNFSSSGSLIGNLTSSDITFNVRFHDTEHLINFSTVNITDLNRTKVMQTSTGILRFYPLATNIKFNFKDDNLVFLTKNQSFIFTARQNQTFNITVNDTENKIRFLDATNGSAIKNATITVTYPDSSTSVKTTNSTGWINVPSNFNGDYQFGTYYFQLSKLGYNTTIYNLTISSTNAPRTYTFNNRRAGIVITTYYYNGSRFKSVVNFNAQGSSNSFSGSTNATGNYNTTNINPNYYEIVFTKINYNPSVYYLNFSNRELIYINVYMSNLTVEKTFYTKDSTLLSPISNVLITFTKQINGSYVTIGQILSDGIGFGSIYLENNVKYGLLIEADNFTTKSMYLNTVVSLSSYDILLNPISTLDFIEFYDLFNYYILPSGSVNLPRGINNFNLTTSSPGGYLNWFVVKYGATVNNVSGSPAGGMASINLNTSAIPEYFEVTYLINIDNFDTITKTIYYHTNQNSYNTSFVNSTDNAIITGNKNKGIFVSLLIVLFVLITNKFFDIDRTDGSKSLNSIIIILPIILFMFIGFISPIIGTLTSALLFFTLIPRGDY